MSTLGNQCENTKWKCTKIMFKNYWINNHDTKMHETGHENCCIIILQWVSVSFMHSSPQTKINGAKNSVWKISLKSFVADTSDGIKTAVTCLNLYRDYIQSNCKFKVCTH